MFFIFGTPRSGTTLLAQCLNAHSAIVIPHETDFIVPMAFIVDRVKDPGVGRDLIHKLIVSTAAFGQSLGEYLDADSVRDAVLSCEYRAASILDSLYARVARVAGKTIAGDKSPNDFGFQGILVKTGLIGPGAKMVHIVRDVRDVMVSLKRLGWAANADAHFPRGWCNANLFLHLSYGSLPDSYVLVKYEEFVANPAEELARLCSFLGLAFEPAMLSPDRRHPRYKGVEAHSNLYNPITGAAVGAFATALDSQNRRLYETQAREALVRFGYMKDEA